MSKITIVGGDILEYIGGKDLSYAKEGIEFTSEKEVVFTAKKGIFYGEPSESPLVEKILPFVDAKVIVHFRPKNWKGEYGFDWFREKNELIKDSEKYDDIVGKYYQFTDRELMDFDDAKFQRILDKYYTTSDKNKNKFPTKSMATTYSKYYITDDNTWYKQRRKIVKSNSKESYEEMISETVHNFKKDPQYLDINNSLQKLKDEYSDFTFNWKNKKASLEKVYYYGSFITLFPKDEYYGKSEAEIELNISFFNDNEKPDYLIFKVDNQIVDSENKFIGIDRVKIENPNEKESIKLSCKTKIDFNSNKKIEVYAVKNQSDKTVKETLAGCITMITPKIKTLNIVTIGVKTKTEEFIHGIPTNDWLNFLKKILGQALVKVKIIDKKGIEPIKIDISETPNFKTQFGIDGDGNINKTDSFAYTMYQKFSQVYPEYSEGYFKLYFVDVSCKEKGEESSGTLGYSEMGDNWGVMFKGHTVATIAHECLHALGLPHSFFHRNSSFVYKAMETNNIMDYSHWGADPIANSTRTPKERYYTWYWQWKIVWNYNMFNA